MLKLARLRPIPLQRQVYSPATLSNLDAISYFLVSLHITSLDFLYTKANDLFPAYMFFTNRYRERTYGPANKEMSNEAGMQDKTEFENKDFRYVL